MQKKYEKRIKELEQALAAARKRACLGCAELKAENAALVKQLHELKACAERVAELESQLKDAELSAQADDRNGG